MFSLWAPINELHQIIVFLLLPATCGLALVWGGKSERAVAIVTLIDFFSLSVLEMTFDRYDQVVAAELKAILILVAYVALTLRWSNRWLVLMTALQAFAVFLHLSSRVDPTILATINGSLLNGVGWAMLLLLAGVTITHIFIENDRRRADREP